MDQSQKLCLHLK
ncbi:hypothetical protein LV92_02255 [Arenibacter echinorum]|uniref:Uncharacterized protein n=1 Tax=Arenibacter echinorum TaxID=440515 RepID=A0A327R3L6_9FLAO|nr:hypothetical protein LV92_02255 [Arenibacter echinorum]